MLRLFTNKAHLVRQLSAADWLVLVEAWWWLLFFHCALRWLSYARLAASQSTVDNPRDLSASPVDAEHVQRLVGYASHLFPRPMTCLVKALALQKMLHARNITAQVQLGVNKTFLAAHAHAWVEVQGKALGEAEDLPLRFAVLSQPAAAP